MSATTSTAAQGPIFPGLSVSFKEFLYWGVGSLALLALAAANPDMATLFVLLLIAGVLLTHVDDYIALFTVTSADYAKKG